MSAAPKTRAECLRAMEDLSLDIARIEDQLRDERYAEIETGERTDLEWKRKAKFALRVKKIERQALQNVMSRFKEEDAVNCQKRRPLAEFFVDAAKRRLDAATFSDLLREAVEDRLLAASGELPEAGR